MADLRLFTAIDPTTLSSGTAIGATQLTPAFIRDREGNTISSMATFGTKAFGVIAPNTSREEQFSFTGISSGTLTGVSHVTMITPYTETSGLNEAHAAGEIVIIQTNSPAFYNEFANKSNDETVVGTWTFTETALPRSSASHSYIAGEEEYFATKRYVDGVALSGAPDASTTQKGVAEEATQAEIAAGTATGSAARLFTNPSTLAAHIQSGAWLFAATGGTASAITATFTPTITALTHGMTLCIHNTTANNAGATFNANGLGAKAIYKYAGGSAIAVEANDMKALYHHILIYDADADVFLLVNPVNGTLTATAQTEVQNFFSATDITGAEAETLTTNGDATSVHYHDDYENAYAQINSNIKIFIGGSALQLAETLTGTGTITRRVVTTEIFSTAVGDTGRLATILASENDASDSDVEFADNPNAHMFASMKFSVATNQDFFFGLYGGSPAAAPVDATDVTNHAGFMVQDGTLYASVADGTTQNRSASIAATLTNYNLFEIEHTGGTSVVFKLNGSTVATLSSNLPAGNVTATFVIIYTGQSASDQNLVIRHPYALKVTNLT